MLNALANHGYLPRDGKDISLARLITGFHDSINLAPDATLLVGLVGVKTSTTGKPYTLHLDDLAKHGGKIQYNKPPARKRKKKNFNPLAPAYVRRIELTLPPCLTRTVIEHDGSLSRHDVHDEPPADNKTFAPEVWATAAAHLSQNESISIETAARARRARIAAAKEADPAFAMSKKDLQASVLETCLYLRVFGEGTVGRARWEWVRVLFGRFIMPVVL